MFSSERPKRSTFSNVGKGDWTAVFFYMQNILKTKQKYFRVVWERQTGYIYRENNPQIIYEQSVLVFSIDST